MSARIVLAVAFAVCLASAPAAAAEKSGEQRIAAREFANGERAFAAGDYRRAVEAFEAAYRLSPHHAPLWNAARSCLKSNQDVRAANLLERYLHTAPADAPDRDKATTALTDVSHRVGRIELQRALARDVELDDTATSAAVVYVAPGEHVVRATANDGSTIVRRLSVAAGAVASVSLAPAETKEPVASPSTGPAVRAADDAKAPIDRDAGAKAASRGISPWFVVAGGVGTVAAGSLAAVFGVQTMDSRDAFRADPTPERYQDAMNSQMRTNVALATTGVFAVATGAIALLLVDWSGR